MQGPAASSLCLAGTPRWSQPDKEHRTPALKVGMQSVDFSNPLRGVDLSCSNVSYNVHEHVSCSG